MDSGSCCREETYMAKRDNGDSREVFMRTHVNVEKLDVPRGPSSWWVFGIMPETVLKVRALFSQSSP